jgi:hypothetical protein
MTVIGTDTEPLDLSEHAKQLGRWLNGLEELHPYPSEGYERVTRGSIYTRLEERLLAEPSHRWLFRNPMQVKVGAGWEDEVVGTRVLIDGEPVTIAAVEPRSLGGWWLLGDDGSEWTIPQYTVLDMDPGRVHASRDRYAQCDDTCTVDCGACKGAGHPGSVTR